MPADSNLAERIAIALDAVRARIPGDGPLADVGVVLGSGLGALADEVEDATPIPYVDIPGFPVSTVAGHAGRLVIGRIGEQRVAVFQGRVHYYEGYDMQEVTFPVRLLRALGAHTMVVTNAAGGITETLRVGDIVVLTDHINYTGANPLRGPNDESLGPRFPRMDDAYDEELRRFAYEVAQESDVPLREGIYLALAGPSYETKAEIRFFKRIGADLVGMSTAAEVIVARHGGMRVLGFSCVTNILHGEYEDSTHEQVLASAREAAPRFLRLMRAIVRRLPGES